MLARELDLGIGADCKDLCLVASLQSLILQLISSMAKLTNEQRDFLMCSLITWLQVIL